MCVSAMVLLSHLLSYGSVTYVKALVKSIESKNKKVSKGYCDRNGIS